MSFDRVMREEARLILLRTLEEQPDGRLNSELLRLALDTYGITKSREWVHDELNWLRDMGAVTLVEASTVRVAQITAKGSDHVARRLVIEGVKTDNTASAIVIEDEADDERAVGTASHEVIVDDDAGETKKTKLPERAVRNDDGTITLPLLKPVGYTVKSGGSALREEVKELVFHDLNGADLRIMAQQSDDMKPVVAFARSTRISTPRMAVIFDQLGSRDIKAGGDIISFLGE